MVIQMKSVLGEEKKLFPLMEDWLKRSRTDEEYQQLLTAVTEACLNAMEHGNGLDPLLPVDVECIGEEGEVVIVVKDHGQGIATLEQSLEGERGWGLKFIGAFVDEFTFYHEIGCPPRFCLEMKKKWAWGS